MGSYFLNNFTGYVTGEGGTIIKQLTESELGSSDPKHCAKIFGGCALKSKWVYFGGGGQ
jgi:hypothetical protein